jgi:hypothetical protein
MSFNRVNEAEKRVQAIDRPLIIYQQIKEKNLKHPIQLALRFMAIIS